MVVFLPLFLVRLNRSLFPLVLASRVWDLCGI